MKCFNRVSEGLESLLIAIKLLCFINWILEIHNVTILIKDFFVAIKNLIVEVIATTFPAVIIVAYLIISFRIFGTILLCFIQCVKLCNIVYLNRIIVIYLIFLHSL